MAARVVQMLDIRLTLALHVAEATTSAGRTRETGCSSKTELTLAAFNGSTVL
jgi:hypothetical protein